MVSVKEAYKNAAVLLKSAGIDSFRLDARVLMENIINADSGKLPLYFDRILTENEKNKYESFVRKRASHIPISYIINKKEFFSLDFYVEEGVLVPRGDTEILVSEALKTGKNKIADLCCGSGCVGLTLAKLLPNSQVTLFDISDKAIEVTKKNMKLLDITNAEVIKSDILKEELPEKYSLIVSNPPYIPASDINTLEKTVKDCEPLNALTDGKDGLTFYKRLKILSEKYLDTDGVLLAEIGINQLNQVKNIFKDISYTCDLAGIPRVIKKYAD